MTEHNADGDCIYCNSEVYNSYKQKYIVDEFTMPIMINIKYKAERLAVLDTEERNFRVSEESTRLIKSIERLFKFYSMGNIKMPCHIAESYLYHYLEGRNDTAPDNLEELRQFRII